MGKVILTYNDISEVNYLLDEQELSFKLHLHDTCGSQSFTIEPLSSCSFEDCFEEMQNVIIKYFEKKNIHIRFMENNLEFMIIS